MADKAGGSDDKALTPDGLAARLQAALGAITQDGDSQQPKQSYAFWGTQPVAQFNEQPAAAVSAMRSGLGAALRRRRRRRRRCRLPCCLLAPCSRLP